MSRKASSRVDRKQPTPGELVEHLLDLIYRKFYAGADEGAKRFQQERRLLLQWVVLWPAKWLDQWGVTLPVARYQEIVDGVIIQAAALGAGAIKYRPAYLGKVVQSHFAVHGDEYYAEGKDAARLAERVLVTALATGQAIPQTVADPVALLVEREKVVAAGLAQRKAAKKEAGKGQLMMF